MRLKQKERWRPCRPRPIYAEGGCADIRFLPWHGRLFGAIRAGTSSGLRRSRVPNTTSSSSAAAGTGLGAAYYLAKEHGITNVAVLEKGWLGGGNTGRNTTIIRSNYLYEESMHIYEHSMKLWENSARISTTTSCIRRAA
jgi:hypothetical protein